MAVNSYLSDLAIREWLGVQACLMRQCVVSRGVRPDSVEEKERDPLSSILIFPPPSLPHSPRAWIVGLNYNMTEERLHHCHATSDDTGEL